MKKFIALLCALISLTMFASCTSHEDPASTSDTSVVVRDPQKEQALPNDELTEFATATQELTNYRLAYSYTSDVENIVTLVQHDGKDEQRQTIFYNKINTDENGNKTVSLDKKESVRYVWSENARYLTTNDKTTKSDYEFALPADKTTFGEMVNKLVCSGFYEAIVKRLSTATYDIINDRYYLDDIEIQHSNETLMFDTAYITVRNRRLASVTCSNAVQTIEISLEGVDDVHFESAKEIEEFSKNS